MNKKILDGKYVSKKIKYKITKKINKRIKKNKKIPVLAAILIGNDIPSKIYIKKKQKICNEVGIKSIIYNLSENINEYNLIKLINKLNNNKNIDGILIQYPLPKHINKNNIIEKISPYKDVDGLHPYNIGKLCQNNPIIHPCTPLGIITLIKYYKIKISRLHAVIVGKSNIVGQPMSLELLISGCTVTITHSLTNNLKYHIKQADLLIVAVGKPNFIPGYWIKKGAIVIDVGINRLNSGKIVGDVDFLNAINNVSYITPVPGGIGPMTVISLIQNILLICEKYNKF
ncbi:bifunctional methylenetetrahydrofolate dehydrogenase/methenyltetrahydrofolate cyclohydrolase FolD [Sodalis-like secondary symbiont of Drepanosiphum platanoidis]